jgi:hypothetical protein
MFVVAPLLALLTAACQPSAPVDPAADVAADEATKAPGEKSGNKKKKNGKKTAKAGKTPTKAPDAPLGVAGDVAGTLALVAIPPAPPVEGAPASTETKTEAKLAMTFADGQSSDVSLGTMPGECAEIPPVPVGPDNKTPLWSVRCTPKTGEPTELHIVQNDAVVSVLRKVDVEGQPSTFKSIKRVRLAEGASLHKG